MHAFTNLLRNPSYRLISLRKEFNERKYCVMLRTYYSRKPSFRVIMISKLVYKSAMRGITKNG